MPDRQTVALLALASLLVVAPAGTATTAATAETGADATAPTRISSCTTITESGEYVLAADVANATPTRPRTGLGGCIEIRADDVLVRGGNHTVAAGPGGRPGVVGVLVRGPESRSNVTVRNLTTTRWGAGAAVLGASGVTLRNVSAVNNLGDGFFVENAPDLRIRGGAVRGSNTGIFLRRSPNASLAGLSVADNLAGVSVRRSPDLSLRNLSVADHSQFGVALFRSANATVTDSTFRDDGFAEIALARSSDARLVGVSVANSSGWEVYAARNSSAVGERVRLGGTHLASFEAGDVALDANADVPPIPLTDRQVVGQGLFVLPTDDEGTASRGSNGSHLSLTVGYDAAAVERARTTEASLALWRFDAGEGWTRVETTVGAGRNVASATVENPSRNGTVVALVGEGLAEAGNESRADY
ncbi:right-handed parallel beta-helix repeat-containing protein [Halorussus gelatinilyticus]|uniref:Right-handed parallel beta-helix repeat-containing protein n=1 Tax=Halorussus gelatinilyticus TaxID=2937524 RepID=A0A8U0IM74_9EURY|nr:NosD domain-containing protein [Halorussus gelatinilyticus]UPW01502.1 right-handed parallel beta-helix repeat-containing protein [Halorussus gelatinilyticus]